MIICYHVIVAMGVVAVAVAAALAVALVVVIAVYCSGYSNLL